MKIARSVLVAALAGTLIAGCSTSRAGGTRVVEHATSSGDIQFVHVADPTFNSPAMLVGDPSGTGVWTWVASTSDFRVLHLTGTAPPVSWSLGRLANSGSDGGLALGKSSTVFVGIHDTLADLSIISGQTTYATIPSPPDLPIAETYRPQELRGTHNVQALAVNPDSGMVVIGLSAASSLEIYDPATSSFSSLSLPTDTEASSLAYLPDGTLGVGLNNFDTHAADEVYVSPPLGGSTLVHVPDASSLTVSGNEFVAGAASPVLVGSRGHSTPAVSRGQARFEGDQHSPVFRRTDGSVVGVNGASVVVLNQSGSPQSTVTVQEGGCGYITPPVGSSASTPGAYRVCPDAITALATDGGGNAWIATAANPGSVGLISTTELGS